MQSYPLKFILVGDTRVGKSQLSRYYTKKTFDVSDPCDLLLLRAWL